MRRLKARNKPHTDSETEIGSDAVCISSVCHTEILDLASASSQEHEKVDLLKPETT